MNKNQAKQHLTKSISNLKQRRGNLTVADLEAEVINNTCLFVLKNQKDKMRQGKTIEEMFLGALNSTQDFIPITSAFTEAAMELFPGQYGTTRHNGNNGCSAKYCMGRHVGFFERLFSEKSRNSNRRHRN